MEDKRIMYNPRETLELSDGNDIHIKGYKPGSHAWSEQD